MTDWMTRKEAAEYLRISVRQLDRLKLPRAVLGASPRYSREALDGHLKQASIGPQMVELHQAIAPTTSWSWPKRPPPKKRPMSPEEKARWMANHKKGMAKWRERRTKRGW